MNLETQTIKDFGPHLYNCNLHVNKIPLMSDKPVVIDVETDEKDNFVGIAITQDGKDVYYFNNLESVKRILDHYLLVGHNIKGDMKWLKKWGIETNSHRLFYDTILASYVQNTVKLSHGLKVLAKEYLGMEWPTYKEMVGSGKKRITLDKQPIQQVAKYCGTDCLATYRLWKYFEANLTTKEKNYLQNIELPVTRVLFDMEIKGIKVDISKLKQLLEQFKNKVSLIHTAIHKEAEKKGLLEFWKKEYEQEFNINSNRHIADLLEAYGASLPTTKKGNKKVDIKTLEKLANIDAVEFLLDYSKYEKLVSTYIEPLLEKNENERIYCSFNQISHTDKGESFGISTGRLSSSNPNLQNIPTKSDEGNMLRDVFVAEEGKVLIDADFEQIEPRLVACFSKDELFIKAFRDGRDIYEDLVEGTGRSRADGKTFMLALLYGAQPKKLASVFECSEQEASSIIQNIMRKLPGVRSWKTRTVYEARKKGYIETMFGRRINVPGLDSNNMYERMAGERIAVNYTIQGSAAEIMKMGLVKLREIGLTPNITVHDEFLIEVKKEGADVMARKVADALNSLVQLDVPIIAKVGIGSNWNEAKG